MAEFSEEESKLIDPWAEIDRRDQQLDVLITSVQRLTGAKEGLTELAKSLESLHESQQALTERQHVVDATVVPRSEVQRRWSRDNLLLSLLVLSLLAVVGLAVHYARQNSSSVRTIQLQRLTSLQVAEKNCDNINGVIGTLSSLTGAVSTLSSSGTLRDRATALAAQVPSQANCSVYAKQIDMLQKETSK